MDIAYAVAKRSKDPNIQVGAIIVDKNKHIIGTGYNGFPPKFNDTKNRWTRKYKYDYVTHAEVNAILHSTGSINNCILYTTMYCCKDCAKIVVSSGIKNVYYNDDKYYNKISEEIFKECDIICKKIK